MKIYFVLFLALPVFSDVDVAKTTEELSRRIETNHLECSKTSHVDPQVLLKARKGDVDLNNQALRNHILCYTKNADLTKNNDLNRPVVKTKLEAQVKGSFDVQKGMDYCDAAVKNQGDFGVYMSRIVDCYIKNFPENTKLF